MNRTKLDPVRGSENEESNVNPYAIDAPVRRQFTDEGVADALDAWAADQREREAWGDRDEGTYRHRANLLEAAAQRLRAPAEAD